MHEAPRRPRPRLVFVSTFLSGSALPRLGGWRRNLALMLIWEAIWGLGVAAFSSSVLTVLLGRVTAEKGVVGLLGLGSVLAVPFSILSSLYLAGDGPLKRRVVWPHFGIAACWIAYGAALWLGSLTAGQVAAGLLLAFALQAAIGGLVAPLLPNFLDRLFPGRYGSYLGLAQSLHGVTGLLGASAVAWILAAWPFPRNFGLLFLVGGSLLWLSNLPPLLIREPRVAVAHHGEKEPVVIPGDGWLKRTLQLFRRYPRLAGLAGVSALQSVAAVPGFYVPLATVDRFQLPESTAGLFATLGLLTHALCAPAVGRWTDRPGGGATAALSLGPLLAALGGGLALAGGRPGWLFAAHVAYALAGTVAGLGAGVLLIRLVPPGPRPLATVAHSVLVTAASAVATSAAGLLVDRTSFAHLFAAGVTLSLVTAGLVRRLF